MVRKLVYAVRFLTVLPIPWRTEERLVDVARSASLFPLVGLFVATVAWGVGWLLSFAFGPTVSRIGTLVAWVVFTGGLHLDGLADTADGVFGGRSAQQRLTIMRDSRIGSFGVLSIVLVLALKGAVLVEMPAAVLAAALLSAAVTARLAQVLLIAAFAAARPDGLGVFFKQHLRGIDVAVSSVLTAAIVWIAGGLPAMVVAAGAVGLGFLAAVWFAKRLGGLTGDVYGAVSEIIELLVLAAFAPVEIASRLGWVPQW